MSRSSLISRNRIPYGGYWHYTDPFTHQTISHPFWDQLIKNIEAHRKANGNPIGLGFEDEIEDYVCTHQPGECQPCSEDMPRPRDLTLSDIIRGSQVMMAFYLAGKPVVERAEAERRAQICLNCPNNRTFAKPCGGVCPELQTVVSAVINHQGTQYDSRLHSCAICACFIQASVWLPLEIQCKGVNDTMKKQFAYAKEKFNCWKTCE